MVTSWSYPALKELLRDEPLPVMLVDLDVLDQNTRQISEIAAKAGKRLRVASKSVRVPALLKRIMETGGEHFQGVMCFCVSEAGFLAEKGFSDLLVAYPSVQPSDLSIAWELTQAGQSITLMVDAPAQLERLNAYWKQRAAAIEGAKPLRVCVDLDMSYRLMGMHLGVQRSPLRDLKGFSTVLEALKRCEHLQLDGLMGYEAQIAGLGDASPFSPALNPAKRAIKALSTKDVARRRKEITAQLDAQGLSIRFFNGGGTGSLRSTTQEDWLTEVTAGSGFLQSHLFDYYRENTNLPASCFGLQVTRQPQKDVITCHSGGFIASGEVGPDKQPLPFLPKGLSLLGREGAGEVQTPLQITSAFPPELTLSPGDPVFFRPAKAGEIAERFDSYLLIQKGQIVDRANTYRGEGQTFY